MVDDWDAATYDRIADAQTRWGLTVLDRLELEGSERVLDAGCGTGRVTEHLVRRLPHGRVVALDASDAMLAEARRRLSPWSEQVEYVRADLGSPLPLDEPVDAVLSTAALHWVPDHDALFRHLAGVLRPGGALVAQCGGTGNVAGVLAIAAAMGRTTDALNFAGVDETARRLQASGFVDVRTWLTHEPTVFAGAGELEAFLATVVLRTHVEGMDSPERIRFVRAVARRMPRAEIDYVRLNIQAGLRGPNAVAGRTVAEL